MVLTYLTVSFSLLSRSNQCFHFGNTVLEEPSSLREKESDGGDWMSWSTGSMAVRRSKSEEASIRHAVAERVRRNRINTHITTLRRLLIPADTNTKTVKATVLMETVRQVRELRRKAAEAAQRKDGEGGESWSFLFPGESDEATVSYCEEEEEGRTVKATVCCEDRPGLNRELMEAIRAVGATTVSSEMGTIGGRTKAEMVVRLRESVGGGGEEDVGSLRRSLKAVMENRAPCSSGLGQMV